MSRVRPGGIVKIPFTELPKEVQERFYYDPEKAAAAQAADMAIVQQTNQHVEESNKQQREAEQQKALESQLAQLQQEEETELPVQKNIYRSHLRETVRLK